MGAPMGEGSFFVDGIPCEGGEVTSVKRGDIYEDRFGEDVAVRFQDVMRAGGDEGIVVEPVTEARAVAPVDLSGKEPLVINWANGQTELPPYPVDSVDKA